MIIYYQEPNKDFNNFLAGINTPKPVAPTPTPDYSVPWAQDSFMNKPIYSGTVANSTLNGLPTGQIVPQYTAPVVPAVTPGTVASITQPRNKVVNKAVDTFNYNANSPQTTSVVNNPVTNPVPGSVAAVQAGMYQSGLTPEQLALQTQLRADQQATATQVLSPEQEYQNQLKNYQAQIDSINAMYADRLNQARIQGQGRIESRQFAQGRSGQIGSGVGEAGVNAVQDANTQIENSIRAEQTNAIADVYAKVRKGADESLAAKTLAKQQGADKLLEYLNNVPGEKKKATSGAVAELLARGVDVSHMTPEEIKSYTSGLGISEEQLKSEFATQSKILADTKKEKDLNQRKLTAEVSNLETKQEWEAAQKALDREMEQKKIDVDWYKAQSERIKTLKNDSAATEKNYDAKTIPATIKKELFSDIESNANMGGTFSGTKKKTLNEFITAYPEINTDYLTALYEANQ